MRRAATESSRWPRCTGRKSRASPPPRSQRHATRSVQRALRLAGRTALRAPACHRRFDVQPQHGRAQRCLRGLEPSLDPRRDGFGLASWRRRPGRRCPARTQRCSAHRHCVCAGRQGAARLGRVASCGGEPRCNACRYACASRSAAAWRRRGVFPPRNPYFALVAWPPPASCCAAPLQKAARHCRWVRLGGCSAAPARRSLSRKVVTRGAGWRAAPLRTASGVPPWLKQA